MYIPRCRWLPVSWSLWTWWGITYLRIPGSENIVPPKIMQPDATQKFFGSLGFIVVIWLWADYERGCRFWLPIAHFFDCRYRRRTCYKYFLLLGKQQDVGWILEQLRMSHQAVLQKYLLYVQNSQLSYSVLTLSCQLNWRIFFYKNQETVADFHDGLPTL